MVGAPAPEPTLNALRLGTPEDYHSAREPSEFEYESEGSEGPSTDFTGYSSMTTMTSYHDTDHTQQSDTKNRDWKSRKQNHLYWWEGHKMNAKKQRDCRSGRVVLPLFWESANWRLEVEEYISKGYAGPKIKDAMFTS